MKIEEISNYIPFKKNGNGNFRVDIPESLNRWRKTSIPIFFTEKNVEDGRRCSKYVI